jgi:two-component system, NtrC family, sensor kinase
MSLTRKAPTAAKKPGKPMRQDLAAALAEREAELAEARRQQAATAEILRVISQTPTDPQPVFERIVVTAARALRCDMAVMLVRDGDVYVHTAAATSEGLVADFAPERFPIDAGVNFPSRAFLAKTMLHLPDWSQIDLPKHERWIHETFGLTSALYWPLLRGDECIGVLVFAGTRPNIFGPGEIAQAESFRDQALIAIQNAQLFDEVQARTKELTEALEHQTATSEVLSAISRSPTEVQPVFDAIARSATELCGATSGGVDLLDEGLIHLAAHYNWSPEALEAMRQIYPAPPSRGFASAGAILTRSVVHIPDISEDPEYTATPVIEIGFRSVLAVPMLRDGEPIGAIALVRLEPRPFTDRQIALLQTFAEQAVIAINNVRLFDEVQAKTRDLEEALQHGRSNAHSPRGLNSDPPGPNPHAADQAATDSRFSMAWRSRSRCRRSGWRSLLSEAEQIGSVYRETHAFSQSPLSPASRPFIG